MATADRVVDALGFYEQEVLPALFDEANKLRRLTVEVLHRLDLSGIDCVLPDLPGCNDSLAPLEQQTFEHWRECAVSAMAHFRPTHVLAIRGGALLDTGNLPAPPTPVAAAVAPLTDPAATGAAPPPPPGIGWTAVLGRLSLALARREQAPPVHAWHLGVLALFTWQGAASMRWRPIRGCGWHW